MTLVDALWVGPSGYDLPPSTRELDSGEAVYAVPEFEARDSDNWKLLEQPALPTTPRAREND